MTFREQLSDREIAILQLLADGAADKEIAAKLHLSLNTVKWHNRQIYTKLDVTSRTQAVAQAEKLGLLGESVEKEKPTSRIPNNLPTPVSSFIGREKEIAEIIELLQDHRLVTLTGPGGVGKTRLALEVASSLLGAGRFPDGIYFVELAPISDPARVGEAVLEEIGLKLEIGQSAGDRLLAFLAGKKILLILDNFEHLLSRAPLVAELLSRSPQVRVLATSREVLALSGEQLYPVPALAESVSQLLFLQRSQEVRPGYEPSPGDLPVIDQICAKLDCLPLAIELSAVRLPLFSLRDLLESLEDRFQVLTAGPQDAPDRHQTLWRVIDWSHELLEREEQILFRRLAVFQGSRNLKAVDRICCYDLNLNAVDGLTSLQAKNLIKGEEGCDGEQRFYMLETVHEFAREQLCQSGEQLKIQERHAKFFSDLVQKARGNIRGGGPNRNVWIKKIDADLFNIRKAFAWSMSNAEYELGLIFVGSLDYYWLWKGLYDEATHWVELALDHISDAPLDMRANVYSSAGMVYYEMNSQYERSESMYLKALSIYEQIGDIREAGWTNTQLININELLPEKRQEVLSYFERAIELLSGVGDKSGIAGTLFYLGNHYANSGDLIDARRTLNQAQELVLELEDDLRQNAILVALAMIAEKEGDLVTAGGLFREALANGLAKDFTYYFNIALLVYIGGIAASLGNPYRGGVLLGAANHLLWEKGYKPQASEFELFDEIHRNITSQISQKDFHDAWEMGRSFSVDEAVAYALEEDSIPE